MQNNIPTEALIKKMVRYGPETDRVTLDSILGRKEEALSYLAKVATDHEYWDMESAKDYSIWAPICAIHLLSVIGGREAERAIEQAIRKYYDDTEDWLTEDMPSVLATLGPDSFGMLAGMVRDQDLDIWVRVGAARALLMISKKSSDVRAGSIQLLKDMIESETDEFTRTMLLDHFIEFRDEQSMPFVKSFFERKMVDTSHLPYDEVLRVYAGEYDYLEHDVPKDPMDIFREEKGNFYRESNCTIAEMLREHEEHSRLQSTIKEEEEEVAELKNRLQYYENYNSTPSANSGQVYSKKVKIGRNEPCPCGSGKKYKKCCMKIV